MAIYLAYRHHAHRPRRITVDGISYEVSYQGDKGHVRVYEAAAAGLRKITDRAVVQRVIEAISVSRAHAEQVKAREVAAAEAQLLGVPGAKPIG